MVNLSGKEKDFLIKFTLFFTIPYAAIHFLDFSLATNAIAGFQNYFLSKLAQTQLSGSTIFANNISFQIVVDCSGLVMTTLFFALVYSTPVKNKLRNFLLFTPVILAFNQLRLFVTLLFGIYYGQSVIELVHALFWFVDAAVVFLLWLHVARIKPKTVLQQVKKAF